MKNTSLRHNILDMHETDFEDFIISICRNWMGESVQSFSKGKDGGKDARFEGIVNDFSKDPQKYIIQAKHASNIKQTCQDNDFIHNQSSVINKEIPKIKKMVEGKELDHYILFTNRSNTGNGEKSFRKKIMSDTGLKSEKISLLAMESIEGFVSKYPNLVKLHRLDGFSRNEKCLDKDIKETLDFLYKNITPVLSIKNLSKKNLTSFKLAAKNKKNNIRKAYVDIMNNRNNYIVRINKCLNKRKNKIYKMYCANIIADIEGDIAKYKDDYTSIHFDDVIEYIYAKIVATPGFNSKHKRILKDLLFFLYSSCHIGSIP